MERRWLALCGVLAVSAIGLLGGSWLANPWRGWPLPAVETPSPNAFDDYRRAGELVSDKYDLKAENPYQDAAVRRRIVAENAEALRVLRAGFAHRYVEPREHAVAMDPDRYYPHCRALGRVLGYEALVHADAGRHAAAIDSLLDAERLGFDLPRRAALYPNAVGENLRCTTQSKMLLPSCVDHLTVAEARAALARLTAMLAEQQILAQSFEDERDICPAKIKRAVRDGHFNDERSLRDPRTWFGPGPYLADYRRFLSAAAAWSKLPWNAAPPPHGSGLFFHADGERGNEARNVCFHRARADAQDHLFLTALALQAWRAEHGGYPDSLDALVPDLLDSVPADPFGRGALKYRREGEKYLLYSVGPGGQDHGGQPAGQRDADGAWQGRWFVTSRGDFVWDDSRVPMSEGWL
jgi:hypothetical protein